MNIILFTGFEEYKKTGPYLKAFAFNAQGSFP